ncbi:MAG: DUF3857 domain-containing protein [Deltaproteobacteria bacterium]|nr:DUF3857 domain-containing protein [Deltaproteobacteria bacterium]
MLELWRNWDNATTTVTTRVLERLARDGGLSAHLRVHVKTLLAIARGRVGDTRAAVDSFSDLGYIAQWRVIGPFDNEGKTGFEMETPPEAERDKAPDLNASYPGRERSVRWRDYPDIVRYGYLSLDAVLRPNENVCAIAEATVHSDRARPLTLWLGASGAVKAYWNGEQVLSDPTYRGQAARDRSAVIVGAYAGDNRLLVKSCITDTSWGLFARLGDEKGGLAAGLSFDQAHAIPPSGVEHGHGVSKLPDAPLAPLAAFEKQVENESKNASALEDLARFLAYTNSDDPAERRAKQLAAQAAEERPTLARLRLAAQLAEERGEVMRFAQRSKELWPDDPDSLFLQASVIRNGLVPEEALPILERIPKTAVRWFQAQLMRASIYQELGLRETAYRILANAALNTTPCASAYRELAAVASASGHNDRAIDFHREHLRYRFDNTNSRRALIEDSLERGDAAEVMKEIDTLHLLLPGSTRNLLYIASIYHALKRDDMMVTSYREAIALAPEDNACWVAYGRSLLDAGSPEAAGEAFRKALALRPQDAETRELLEQIERVRPQQRADEAYALPVEPLLRKRRSVGKYQATILQKLDVNTVFENGLGSSFSQLVVQIHNSEGARNWDSYSIQFDPDSQRVELRLARVYRADGRVSDSIQTYEQSLSQPWYRMYYDTRALVVVFQDLEPGDTIEIRYRVDDIAYRNLFADYFGDLHAFMGFIPTEQLQYVLITPASRHFYFNQPALAGLKHTRTTKDARRIDRFIADDIPAIHSEDGMPGMTEISPYLHVSTYRSWSEVGRWYWGLIKDQLYADESLKAVVRDLVKGIDDTLTKVQRIHNWVVRRTRYVALEFGIHGFMPYRVPLVVQRGFGDCKDKASLLYTMFREAGIDSRIVLVRTRGNGDIDPRPASLSVFDHAIVYIPSIDLYLDGTAEHNGTAELPAADQGVMVLLVGPNSSELRFTPVFDSKNNRRTRTLHVRLATDGSAQIDGQEDIVGSGAAEYRDYYQASGTRSERFERSLTELYPGVELLSQSFKSIEELERPVVFTYRAKVPQMAPWDGDELRLPPSVLKDLLRKMARSPSRRYPLDLGGTQSYLEQLTVQIPHGLEAVHLPSSGEVSSEFGRFNLKIEAKGKQITSSTAFEINRDRVTVEQYPAFRRWIEQADVLLRQRISIRKSAP